jgi:hypothetical protein
MATRHMCTHTTTSARCAHKHRGDRVVTAPRRVPLSCCLARGCQWQRGSSVCATAPPLAAPPSLLRRRSSLPGARDGTTSTGRHVRPHLPHVRPRARRLRAQKAEEREGLPGSSSGRYEWLASGFADVRRLSLAFACPPHTHGSTPPGRSRSHLKHPLLQVGGWVVAVDARAQHDMRRLQWIAMGLEEALGGAWRRTGRTARWRRTCAWPTCVRAVAPWRYLSPPSPPSSPFVPWWGVLGGWGTRR